MFDRILKPAAPSAQHELRRCRRLLARYEAQPALHPLLVASAWRALLRAAPGVAAAVDAAAAIARRRVPEHAADFALLQGMATLAAGRPEAGREQLLALLPRLRDAGWVDHMALALAAVGETWCEDGHGVRAAAYLGQAARCGTTSRFVASQVQFACSTLHLMLRQHGQVLDCLDRARACLPPAAAASLGPRLALRHGFSALLVGRAAEAVQALRTCRAMLRADQPPRLPAIVAGLLAWGLADLGDTAGAATTWHAAQTLRRGLRLRGSATIILSLARARVLARCGQPDQAQRVAALALRQASRSDVFRMLALETQARLAEDQGLLPSATALRMALAALHQRVLRTTFDDVPGDVDAALLLARLPAGGAPRSLLGRLLRAQARQWVEAQAQARLRGETDPVTRLPNAHSLATAIDGWLRAGQPFTVACIELVEWRLLNQVLGTRAAEALLRQAAATLRRLAGEQTVYHPRRCQFVLSTDSADPGAAVDAALQELEALAADVGPALKVAAGLVRAPAHADDAQKLLDYADLAVNRRSHGTRMRWFRPALQARRQSRERRAASLIDAPGRGELCLVLQPRFQLADLAPCGVEAQLHWRSPDRGLLTPAEFMPLAEYAGQAPAFERWALDAACALLARWHAHGLALRCTLAITGRGLLAPDLPDALAACRARGVLAAGMLEFEFSEQALSIDAAATLARLDALHGMGIALSLRDFGAGRSSVVQLDRIPLTTLKLDHSFVQGVQTDARARAIVAATGSLARAFELQLLAEGVDDAAQARALAALGVAGGLGSLAPPLPVAAFEVLFLGAAATPDASRK